MPDHIYILVKIPLKMSISNFIGYLKGKSVMMIFIAKYIGEQDMYDKMMDKISIKELNDR